MGQALATANICATCGEKLNYIAGTDEPCAPNAPGAHYHERKPVRGSGTVPECCKCWKASGNPCHAAEEPQQEEEEAEGDEPAATD